MKKKSPVVGVTLGDPAGIGPEVVKKALRIIGRRINVEVVGDAGKARPVQPSVSGAKIAQQALVQSVQRLKRGQWAAVVNGPISKEWMHQAGFRFPGQTEFYAKSFGLKSDEVTMIMVGPRLRVALANTHLSLRNAVKGLRKSHIVRSGVHLAQLLKRIGHKKPRIAVCGLNPHAGERGAFGNEEARIIQPAVKELKKRTGLSIFGPESPDAVFRHAMEGRYDGVVAMYHDQGLIPAKLLDFDSTVNVTAGLPVVRCSPDHGTAFGLAGRGMARPDSFVAALRLAHQLVLSRSK